MNHGKITSLILILCLGFMNGFSQKKNTDLDLLKSKYWDMQGMTDKTSGKRFSESIIYNYFNNELLGESEYYLSNTQDKHFKENKIGKMKMGKYIIYRNLGVPDNFSVFEIISLTEDSMELRNVKHTHTLKFKSIDKVE